MEFLKIELLDFSGFVAILLSKIVFLHDSNNYTLQLVNSIYFRLCMIFIKASA